MKMKLGSWAMLVTVWFGIWRNIDTWAAADRTNSARFHDYMDSGCHATPGGAGAPSTGMSKAGGNQAQCISCGGAEGMPTWWVDEPYLNLWVTDEPLSYYTSSGQKMTFRWTYHQRGQVEDPWRSRELPTLCQNQTVGPTGYKVLSRYTINTNSVSTTNMTDATWSHNWWSEITFWDPSLETAGTKPSVIDEFGSDPGNPTNAYVGFTGFYQGLLFRGDGGTIYFDINNATAATGSGKVRVQVINPTSSGGPHIPYEWEDAYTGSNDFVYPLRGPFFVANTYSGFQVTYPDGSQDIYGLIYWQANVTAFSDSFYGAPPKLPRVSTAVACMTKRIDPQGRVSLIGYEPGYKVIYNNFGDPVSTNFAGYRVKYVLDADGRTNTYSYNLNTNLYDNGDSWRYVQGITDPYGRTAQFTQNTDNGALASITDAQNNSSSFSYVSSNGWMTGMTTPYGNTSFAYYQLQESGATNEYERRAAYVSEPEGAQQLFFYIHSGAGGVPATTNVPSVPSETFDNGTNGTGSSTTYALSYRNTFHWGRRQFPSLSSSVKSSISTLSTALGNLTAADFTKAGLKHWMLGSDQFSVTETLSAERDPSTDTAGSTPGIWTFYGNGNSPTTPEIDQGNLVSSVAQLLPNGTSSYTRYHYSGLMVSDSESSVTKPDGTQGELTNWFAYAANGIDLTNVHNSLGHATTMAYNSAHQVTNVVDALNETNRWTWDTNTFNPTGITLASGKTFAFTYYASNLATLGNNSSMLREVTVQPEGLVVDLTNYANSLPGVTHVSGTGLADLWVTSYWDGLNRLTGTAFTNNLSVSNVYTALDLTAHKDGVGNWTQYDYDGLQHLTTISNANGGLTTLTWCGCGSLTSVGDALHNTNTLSYDNQGRLTGVTYADTSSVAYQYDLNGRLTSVTDGSSRSVQVAYNNQGQVTNVSNTYGSVLQATYDLVSRPYKITDANGVTITNGYDVINRLTNRIWTTDGNGESFVYATNGLVGYTNRNGVGTHWTRDGAGRALSVTNALGNVTQFAYDAADRLITLTDPLSHPTTWNYNLFGWLTGKVDAQSRTILTNGFDGNGRVINRWLLGSGNTTYAYDAMGNLTNVSYPGAASPTATVSLGYDADNRLTSMIDGVGTTAFAYTASSRLQSEAGPWTSNTVTYGYTQGHRTSLSLLQPTGGAWGQAYGYDNAWRMNALASPAGISTYSYPASASALIQSLGLTNTAGIAYQYDSLARLTSTALTNSFGRIVDSLAYGYDALGQRTSAARNLGLTVNFIASGYDGIGQMTNWTATEIGGAARGNEQETYGYDQAGNLHYRTNGGLTQAFTVDSLNQLSTIGRAGTLTVSGNTPAPASVTVNGNAAQTNGDFTFAKAGLSLINGANSFTNVSLNAYGVLTTNTVTVNLPTNVSFTTDNNGNLTSDGTRTFVYDAENQLTNVNVANLWKTEFTYDGLGRKRIAKDYNWQSGAWVKTNETRFVYDGMNVIQERDSNNVVKVTYTRGQDLSGSLSGAGGIGGLLARTDASGSAYYHSDGAGNITALMDANQNVVARYEYDGFGKLIGKWGALADANHYRFSSKEVHSNSGLYYYGYRFYDPSLQRWINKDPIGIGGGINLYRFNFNSPLNAIDPYGLNWLIFDGQAWGQLAHDTFYGPDFKSSTPNPDSQLALSADAGIGPTPLKDEQGNTILPGDLVQNTVLDAAAQVAMLPLGGPEDEGAYLAAEKALAKLAAEAKKCEQVAKALPAVNKAVNSELPHAAAQAVSRGVFDTAANAANALRDLSQSITQNGFPAGTLPDTAYTDRVLVPVGNNGMAVYQVGANGTAKLKTVLIAH